MKLRPIPENLRECLACACGMVPTPLLDTLVALLLANTVMAGTAVGVFEALAAGDLTADDISLRCGSDHTAMQKMLRALCACGYLRWNKNRYALSQVSRRWLLRGARHSLYPAILHRELDLRAMRFEEYVREGKAQDFHGNLSEEEWKLYHQGQASHAALSVDEVVARAPMPRDATDLLDLGGGHGLYSFAFCDRYPRLRARVLDLAATGGNSGSSSMPDSPWARVEFQVADIRTAELPAASCDTVLLANVLHHFDEATNRDLLQRAARSLRPGGMVIALDAVRPAAIARSEQLEALFDLYFGATSGAGLWTIEQLRLWQQDAGLQPMPPITLRLLPFCKMQAALKIA
jgi:SAM-dependent methyltransferase